MKRYLKIVKWFFQIVATIILLYVALQRLETDKLLQVLSEINLLLYLPIPIILIIDLFINSYRILSLYKFYGVETDIFSVFKVKFHGFFFSLIFPLFGDAYKIQSFKTLYRASYLKNSLVVFLDRLLYTFSLTLILLPVWLLSLIEVGTILQLILVTLFVIEMILLYILNQPVALNWINKFLSTINRKLQILKFAYESKDQYLRTITTNTVIAALRHSLIAIIYILIAYSVIHNLSFSIVGFAFTVFTIMISKILPVSIGGIGLREFIAVSIFPQIGVSAEHAFLIAFIMSSIMILQGLVSGLSLLSGQIFKMNKVIE
ncbi:MAG: flippase-like domain-containing protein [Candidatus Cloacimonetes bacterium]|nr:flippase-like domain-containing protein [Candidatus Cloacimonadota bacterium]